MSQEEKTVKEQAENAIKMFNPNVVGVDNAKAMAIECVDEVMSFDMTANEHKYWQDVKSEIEKL